jgi:hypothetical protein
VSDYTKYLPQDSFPLDYRDPTNYTLTDQSYGTEKVETYSGFVL